MLEAVLFDWGDTLMPYEGSATEEFIAERTRAGLAALERDGLPEPSAIGAWFAARVFDDTREDEEDYLAVLGTCFTELGCELNEEEIRRYAEESLWERELVLHPQTLALLDSLRERGLKLALVSNTGLPAWLLGPVLDRHRVAERLDAVVLSSEVGKRKPHPAIFEHALGELGVEPEQALFVGDRLYHDVRGAGNVGMKTVQAVWTRADEHSDGVEPDYQAFTQMDVLNIVRRLLGER